MKVPFQAKVGTAVTLGLELPNQLVLAIDGIVQKASAVEGEGNRTWIEIELVGFTEEVMQKIRAMAGVPATTEPEPTKSDTFAHPPPARKSESRMAHDLPPDD